MTYNSFVFVGPFENFAAADQYGQSYAEGELWTVERLVKPENAELAPLLQDGIEDDEG